MRGLLFTGQWTMTGAEVDALRLPLKKKLAALADLPVLAYQQTTQVGEHVSLSLETHIREEIT